MVVENAECRMTAPPPFQVDVLAHGVKAAGSDYAQLVEEIKKDIKAQAKKMKEARKVAAGAAQAAKKPKLGVISPKSAASPSPGAPGAPGGAPASSVLSGFM
jgi:hypothetical protein